MKVSIICPLYNSLDHLQAMIESLQRQTMPDFEVIIVDDHSSDGSLQRVKELTIDDQRFRFLQTPLHSGPGVARNIGINTAKGQYISFIDSDDMYAPNFLQLLFDASEGDKDMTYCQLRYVEGKIMGKAHRNPVVPNGYFTPLMKKHFLRSFITFSVCFLYRREFLMNNNLRFPELYNSEDTNFLIKCILLAKTIGCVDIPLYYYNIRQGSLTNTYNKKRPFERLNSMTSLMKSYSQMKREARHSELKLNTYNTLILYLWFKKGLLLAIIEFIKTL